jgi:hypothetical protein
MTALNKTQDTKRFEQFKARAKQVILQIVRQANGRFQGKLKLYKVFYLAHLLYAEKAPGYLTEWPIVRMPHGPGIGDAERLLSELASEGVLNCKSDRHPTALRPVEYEWTGKELPADGLPPAAIEAIREAIALVSGKNAAELSEWTHEWSRSWNEAKDGEELNIYIDLMPEDEYRAQSERLGEIWKAIRWQDRPEL